jgi:hypothetical protein
LLDPGEKKMKYNETELQVFRDFRELYDLVKKKILQNILIRAWSKFQTR